MTARSISVMKGPRHNPEEKELNGAKEKFKQTLQKQLTLLMIKASDKFKVSMYPMSGVWKEFTNNITKGDFSTDGLPKNLELTPDLGSFMNKINKFEKATIAKLNKQVTSKAQLLAFKKKVNEKLQAFKAELANG